MSAARLTRRWQEAAGDPALMVEALCEELEERRATGRGVGIANAARLVRRWQEAGGDPARMAEALVDELDLSAAGGIAPNGTHDRHARMRP
jgi:hypothetical protein